MLRDHISKGLYLFASTKVKVSYLFASTKVKGSGKEINLGVFIIFQPRYSSVTGTNNTNQSKHNSINYRTPLLSASSRCSDSLVSAANLPGYGFTEEKPLQTL